MLCFKFILCFCLTLITHWGFHKININFSKVCLALCSLTNPGYMCTYHRAMYMCILTRALTPRYTRPKVLKPCGRIHVYVQTNTKAWNFVRQINCTAICMIVRLFFSMCHRTQKCNNCERTICWWAYTTANVMCVMFKRRVYFF